MTNGIAPGACANSVDSPKIEMTTEYAIDAGEDGRDERVGLEVVAVQHLDREQRGAERRAEHRRDAGRDAGTIRMRRSRAPTLQQPARTVEPSAPPICIVGPSRPPEPPRPEREDRRQRLDPRDAPRTTPPWWWKASIIASPPPPRVSGASRQTRPGQQGARGGQDQDDERVAAPASPASPRIFSPCARSGRVAGDAFEQEASACTRAPRRSRRRAGRRRTRPARCASNVRPRIAQIERGRHGTERGRERRRTTGALACATLARMGLLGRLGGPRSSPPQREDHAAAMRLRRSRAASPGSGG